MSSYALVEGPNGILGGWETEGSVRWARLDGASAPAPFVVAGASAKHPALAVDRSGNVLFAWTEGTGWQRGGALAWQLFDRSGRPLGPPARLEGAIPVWGLATVAPRPGGGFLLIH